MNDDDIKARLKIYRRRSYEKHKESRLARNKLYRLKNAEKLSEAGRQKRLRQKLAKLEAQYEKSISQT